MLEDVLENQSHRQLFALELGSGTGQHVIRFAQKIPFVTWQPSDITQECLDRLVVLGTSLRNLMLTCSHQSNNCVPGSNGCAEVKQHFLLHVCLQH